MFSLFEISVNCQHNGKPENLSCLNMSVIVFIIQKLQVNLIIMLSLGFTESDLVICEPCFNEVAYNRHIVKLEKVP